MKYESYEEHEEVRFGTISGLKEFKRLKEELGKSRFLFLELLWVSGLLELWPSEGPAALEL